MSITHVIRARRTLITFQTSLLEHFACSSRTAGLEMAASRRSRAVHCIGQPVFIAFPSHNFWAAWGKAHDRSRLVNWLLAAAIFVALTAIPSQLLRSGYLIDLQKQWRYFLLEWCPASNWVLNSKCAAPTS